jgi:hypothetical protein
LKRKSSVLAQPFAFRPSVMATSSSSKSQTTFYREGGFGQWGLGSTTPKATRLKENEKKKKRARFAFAN